MVIAEAEFMARRKTVAGYDEKLITVTLELPELDPLSSNGDHRCRILINGFFEPAYSHGMDSLQAIGQGYVYLRMKMKELKEAGWLMYCTGQNSYDDKQDVLPFGFCYCGDWSDAPWA